MALRRRTVLLLAAVIALAAAIVTGWLMLPGIVEDRAVAEARARKVELEISAVEVSWGRVRLAGVEMRPIGVERARAKAEAVTIELDWLTPTAISIDELVGALEGVAVFGELAGWVSQTSRADSPVIPVEASEVVISWREMGASEPAVVLGAGGLSLGDGTGRLRDAAAAIGERRYGPTDASWEAIEGGLAIWFGSSERERAPIAAAVRPGSLEATLAPTPIGAIADFLSIALPRRDVLVESKASLELRDDDGPAALESTLEVRLLGFVPPHPKELDGILFGEATTATVDAVLDPDRLHARLTKVVLEAGALRLEGEGAVKVGLDRSIAELELRGSVPCRQLTASAVAAHLGREAGLLAGALAKKALAGSVAVHLEIAASSESFDRPSIRTSASVGCRIDLLQGFPKPKLFDGP